MKLVSIVIALLALTTAHVHAADNAEEFRSIARQVRDNTKLMEEAKVCPAKLMRPGATAVTIEPRHCTAGKLQACLVKCLDGHANSCYWLANVLQHSGEGDAGDAVAEPLFQRSCKLGVMSGCTNRTAGMLYASSAEPVQQCAAESFAKICDNDDPWACTMYAQMLVKGEGVARNDTLALKVMDKSCKFGPEDDACKGSVRIRKMIAARQRAPK